MSEIHHTLTFNSRVDTQQTPSFAKYKSLDKNVSTIPFSLIGKHPKASLIYAYRAMANENKKLAREFLPDKIEDWPEWDE